MEHLMIFIVIYLTCLSTAVWGREELEMHSKDYLKYSKTAMAGAMMGLSECHKQFKYQPWNCFVAKDIKIMPIVSRSRLAMANKEAAFIHAITSAGVMYSVIKNCSLGNLENCRCQPKGRQRARSRSSHAAENWHWGGCSDNVAFGDLVARHFIDELEGRRGENNDRRAINLHNNKVGRKIVKATSKKVCKCHGQSSSCTMKTCMKKVDSFDKIGEALLETYHNAIHVTYKNGSLFNDRNKKVTKKKNKLVYYTPSPDYCKANKKLRIPGVEGRVCEAKDGSDMKRCRHLCESCGLKPEYKVVTKTEKCNCKFVWCCFVKCDECKKKLVTVTCVR